MAYSTAENIEQIISDLGLTFTTADDPDDLTPTQDAGNTNAAIEKADSKIDLYLQRLYAQSQYATSTWVKWCSATLASCLLFKRRGGACPDSLAKECDEYMGTLKEIASGELPLPGAVPFGNRLPSVTNVTVDMRYGYDQIRRVPQTSSPKPQTAPINHDLTNGWRN